ncbi:MAG: type II toxin-antitoxin system HicA family toxin [Armatimonadetes bacterium]|nr:type II toxin-antitoxin system HicA family toxin [Armatimonadota bacterium]
MSRLPRVSGKKTARALERHGFELRSISGDHARYRHPVSRRTAIVPLGDRVLPVGTLANILRQAGLTADEFRELL